VANSSLDGSRRAFRAILVSLELELANGVPDVFVGGKGVRVEERAKELKSLHMTFASRDSVGIRRESCRFDQVDLIVKSSEEGLDTDVLTVLELGEARKQDMGSRVPASWRTIKSGPEREGRGVRSDDLLEDRREGVEKKSLSLDA
ncbi:hypothetical protein DYB37_007663, partial [Aphanomyces astaci]